MECGLGTPAVVRVVDLKGEPIVGNFLKAWAVSVFIRKIVPWLLIIGLVIFALFWWVL